MALTIRVRPKFPARVLGSDGISIAKIGGTYTFSLDADLAAVAAVSGTGIVRRLSASSWTAGTAVSLAEMSQRSASTLLGNPTGVAATPAEITIASPLAFSGTVLSIPANGITDAFFRQGAAFTVVGRSANSTGNVADIAGTTDTVLRVNAAGTALGFGAVNLASGNAVSGTLAVGNAGTGITSYAVGDILYASTTTVLSKLADVATGNVLTAGGVGVAPAWGKVTTAHISNDQITDALLRNSAGLSVIGRSTNSTGDPADIVGTTDQVLRVAAAGTSIGFGAINIASGNAVSGTLAVGNGGTGLTGAAWSAYTPTVTSSTGTLTSASATGAWQQIGKTVFVKITATVTTNGTGSGTIRITLPATAADVNYVLFGREAGVSGKSVQAISSIASGATLSCVFYDNTYPGADGAIINLTGVYQST